MRMNWLCLVFSALALNAQVPRTWTDKDLSDWALPVASLNLRPGHFSEAEYYNAPADNLRSYPVYHPDREPAGYWDELKKKKPEPLLTASKEWKESDWIRAGKRVFDEFDVVGFRTAKPELIAKLRSREQIQKAGIKPRHDGTLPVFRWVVTPRGVQLSLLECAGCHQRELPDGTILNGPGSSDPANPLIGEVINVGAEFFTPGERFDSPIGLYRAFSVPWLKDDVHKKFETMKPDEIGEMFASHIAGTFARVNGSPFFLTKMPDLIGIRERKYMDATATHRNRGPADIMRYAALVTSADSADFGSHRMFTDSQRKVLYRSPDEVLYALAQYIYALEPPTNPNKFDAKAAAGQALFQREGCPLCHTPPFYTNNKITPALGYRPPKDHPAAADILNISVGTDPNLALKTRKGTGFYKVPSLKGVWYRGLYMHDGSLATLEEMFNPSRLRNDYVPNGFKGYRVTSRSVPGHEFGLKLPAPEREQLIAFLRTL
jgi:mono/diheme cytochrome c family protein